MTLKDREGVFNESDTNSNTVPPRDMGIIVCFPKSPVITRVFWEHTYMIVGVGTTLKRNPI